MTLILNQFIETDIKAQRKQYLIHNLVIEDWNPLVAKEDAPIKQLSLDLLINMIFLQTYKTVLSLEFRSEDRLVNGDLQNSSDNKLIL